MIKSVDTAGARGPLELGRENPARVFEEFEAVFISYLIRDLRNALTDEMDKGLGSGGEVYMGLVEQCLSESLARAGGIGLRDLLEKYVDQQVHADKERTVSGVKA